MLTVADAPFGKGGSWNRSGQILFAPSYNSAIHIVSENGGSPTPVTALDPESNQNSHRFPFFLPDGRHFLYLARVSEASDAKNEIEVGSIDANDAGTLLESESQAVYRAGFVLYVKDVTLLARPFDPASLALEGQPFADPDPLFMEQMPSLPS